jgi:hypothetical protein
MSTTIEVQVKHVYGLQKLYIVTPKVKEAIETLTGRKTLNENDILALKLLGFEIQVQPTEATKL